LEGYIAMQKEKMKCKNGAPSGVSINCSKSAGSMEDIDIDDPADGSCIVKRLLMVEEKRAIDENPPSACKKKKLDVINN
jgi:hypothetical protein